MKKVLLALTIALAPGLAFAQSAPLPVIPGFFTSTGCPSGALTPCFVRTPATIYSGQQTLTASAAALPSQTIYNGIVITAKSTNTGTVYVGPAGVTSATGYPLVAGQSISYAVTNLSAIYILDSVTTDGVAFTGN